MIAIDLACGETWNYRSDDSVRVLYLHGGWGRWEINQYQATKLRVGQYVLDDGRGPLLITGVRGLPHPSTLTPHLWR